MLSLQSVSFIPDTFLVYSSLPDPSTKKITSFLALSNSKENSQDPSTPSDLYEGKLGYLYTLLSLRNRIAIPVELPPMEALVGMTRHVIEVGEEGSNRLFSGFLDREGVNSQVSFYFLIPSFYERLQLLFYGIGDWRDLLV
jgi:hypothetical protein